MTSLPIKETLIFQPLPPQRKRAVLTAPSVILRLIIFGALLLLTVAYTSKRAWSSPEGQARSNQDVVPAAEDNRTVCLVEVIPERAQKPAIGFDLTDSYGTATILLPSGETINVGPVYGNCKYRRAIEYFAKNSSKHTAPPYNWWYDPPGGVFAGLWDSYRELLRSIRKRAGLPASSQVGALASLLTELRAASSRALASRRHDSSVDAVVLSSLDLGALYDEDLYDAAIYARLSAANVPGPPRMNSYPFTDSLMTDSRFNRQPKHVDAAQMGFGLGLCSHYLSTSGCRQDEQDMVDATGVDRNHLSLLVTRRGVGLESRVRKVTARTEVLYWQQHDSYYDAGLGVLQLLGVWGDQEKEEEFWQRFRAFVGQMVSTTIESNVTDVFMIGESAGFRGFRQNVVRAIMEADLPVQNGEPVVHENNLHSRFVASKGAAEMARRVLVAPTDWGYPEGVEGVPRCRP